MPRKKPLSEQVVVVAGGSYGLGRAIAEEAAERGARVVVGARTEEALGSARVDLALMTDVSDRSPVEPQPRSGAPCAAPPSSSSRRAGAG